MGCIFKTKKGHFSNGNLRRLGKRHTDKMTGAVDRKMVAAFNDKRRHVKVTRWNREKRIHVVVRVLYKNGAN